MSKSQKTKFNDLRIAQIIDANLDRAREGLRVLEDWARFGLGRDDFVRRIKNFRQILGKHHLNIYKESRNYIKDDCKGLNHPEQLKRNCIEDILSSNAARAQEALRVIEEFSRNNHKDLSFQASQMRYEIYKLEIELLESSSNKDLLEIILKNNLYFITIENPQLISIIEKTLEGGVKIVQHRFKNGNDKNNLQLAKEIKTLCHKFGALFIVNDRVDIAFASDADGVHLGQKDLNVKEARKILGFSKIIGVSATNDNEIKNAIKNGCDYLGIGPLFETPTKADKLPLGLKIIKDLTKDLSIPWFAIGGIKHANISLLKENGITKIALISDIINSENPKEKANMIIKSLSNENKSKRRRKIN